MSAPETAYFCGFMLTTRDHFALTLCPHALIGSADTMRTRTKMDTGKLSEETIKKLRPKEVAEGETAGELRAHVYYFAGQVLQGVQAPKGFGVRVTPNGAKAFVMNYRIRGREYRYTIGAFPDWSALKAVRAAKELRRRIDRGENPLDDRKPTPKTKRVEDVLDDFISEKARGKAAPLRKADAIESAFKHHVNPEIGHIGVGELKRDDILRMRKKISNKAGPVAADRTVAYFRAAMRWFATEVTGGSIFDVRELPVGSLTNAKERRRKRTLDDNEIRLVWRASLAAGTFGALVRALLLTVQRRGDVAGMARPEIASDDIWTIPGERYKSKQPHFVPLSAAAIKLIEAQPKMKGCDLIFPSSAKTPFTAFGKPKKALDAAILKLMREEAVARGDDPNGVKPLPNWRLHDLRRSGRTQMSRERVPSEISERVLGHAVDALVDTYDRHTFEQEKREALEALARRIDLIVNPPANNVASLEQERARRV